MRVLRLPAYYPPEQAASSYLWSNIIDHFIQCGHEVDIYAPTPTRGVSLEVRAEYKKRKLEILHDGKLRVHRFSMYGEGKNPALRAMRYVLCCCKHFYHGITAKDIDVMFLSSTPPIQGAMGAIIKKFRKIPILYSLQDIFPDYLAGTSLDKL